MVGLYMPSQPRGVVRLDVLDLEPCLCREPPGEGLMCELLWSDPQPQPGRSPSKRGVGVGFGMLSPPT